jgi:hypothetical protein
LLNRIRAGFTGADANGLFQIHDEDLSVSDIPRECRVRN